ncbi:MAG: hypothetical protein ACYTGG_10670 [Planctomycetota bacterium]
MIRSFHLTVVFAIALILATSPAAAQPVTSIVTHGYSLDQTKGPWLEAMAEAIRARAGAGAVMRYRESDGAWQLVSGTLETDQPVALIYRWLDDFSKAGAQFGYAEAAADALVAALRDPVFVDQNGSPLVSFPLVAGRDMHLLGHSRGTIVNSEAAERFGVEGITVDHVTTMDPHPVNGTLDAPYDEDWGDPVPQRWSNITWADNYWRADGGGIFNGLDFDGIPLPNTFDNELDESALNCCAYTFAHSDVHLWYHGTIDLAPFPCDGEQCINQTMRDTWWPEGYTERGYYYSIIGGGAAQRPAITAGVAPGPVPSLAGGTFDEASYAGWLYHGGATSTIVDEGGRTFLKLGSAFGPSAAHNRFFLPDDARAVRFSVSVITPDNGDGDDLLEFSLEDRDGSITLAGPPISLAGPATDWTGGIVAFIPNGLQRGRAFRLRVDIVGGAQVQSVTGVDDIEIVRGPAGDLDLDGAVNINDLLALLASWGPCPAPPAACPADLDGDGVVGITDLLALLANWG